MSSVDIENAGKRYIPCHAAWLYEWPQGESALLRLCVC